MIKRNRQSFIWVVSGPSGSGKTTICNRVLHKKGNRVIRSVSITTRPKKRGEKNNKDYVFVTKEEFSKRIKNGEFVEWERVFGNLYGTSKKLILKELSCNRDVLLCIDVKGALQVRKKFPGRAILIFITTPNRSQLNKRIRLRARENAKEIEKRLGRVSMELSFAKWYDYIIVNDKLTQSVNVLESIITAKRAENGIRSTRKNDQ